MASEDGAQHHAANHAKVDVLISESANSTMLPAGMDGASVVDSFATDVPYPIHEGFPSGDLGTTLPSAVQEEEEPDGRPVPISYPRTVTAMQLLAEDDDDDEDPFCGPPVDEQDEHLWENRALEVWDIGTSEAKVLRKNLAALKQPATNAARTEADEIAQAKSDAVQAAFKEAALRGLTSRPAAPAKEEPASTAPATTATTTTAAASAAPTASTATTTSNRKEPEPMDASLLIRPPGNLKNNQKFICVLPVCLEDDLEFCLVKRILGKGGNNMRRIADECNAKVRLRGIGSGFKEGPEKQEADMPLQLNLSCTEYSKYAEAVGRLAALLQELFRHYRRYAKSKQLVIPELKVAVDELRRDDIPGFKAGEELNAEAGFHRGTSSQAAREGEGRSGIKKTTAAENSEMERERRAEEERARRRKEATEMLSGKVSSSSATATAVTPASPAAAAAAGPSAPAAAAAAAAAPAAAGSSGGPVGSTSAGSRTTAAAATSSTGKGAAAAAAEEGAKEVGKEGAKEGGKDGWPGGKGGEKGARYAAEANWWSPQQWTPADSEAWRQGWNDQSAWRRQSDWGVASTWTSKHGGWWG